MGLIVGGIYDIPEYDARVVVVRAAKIQHPFKLNAAIALKGGEFEDVYDLLLPEGIVYTDDTCIKVTLFNITIYPRADRWNHFNWEKAYVGMLDRKFHPIMQTLSNVFDPYDDRVYDSTKNKHLDNIVSVFYSEKDSNG
jgi:hypothetical protein